ncbi:MAG: SCO family protein, partial [Nevskiales bacterium]
DNTATLKSYIEYFNPGFVAITGSEPELRKLTDALYMPYSYAPTGQGDDYSVEHSGALVLINPQGQAAAYFSPPLKVGPIVNDLRELVKS